MRRVWKRILAMVLFVTMFFTIIPVQALAALVDLPPTQREALLEDLREAYGSEESAREAFDFLLENGIVDEKGNVQQWDIQFQGKTITLDEAREMIESGAYLDQKVVVDDTEITLAELKTMLEIHDEIERLRETYFTEFELTPEQEESFQSLYRQLATEGISFETGNTLREKEKTICFEELVLGYSEPTNLGGAYSIWYSLYRGTSSSVKPEDPVQCDVTIAGPISATKPAVTLPVFPWNGPDSVWTNIITTFYDVGQVSAKTLAERYMARCDKNTPLYAYISNVKGATLTDAEGNPVERQMIPVKFKEQFGFRGGQGVIGGEKIEEKHMSITGEEAFNGTGKPFLEWSDSKRTAMELGAYDKFSLKFPMPEEGVSDGIIGPYVIVYPGTAGTGMKYRTLYNETNFQKDEGGNLVLKLDNGTLMNLWDGNAGSSNSRFSDALYVYGLWGEGDDPLSGKAPHECTVTYQDTQSVSIKNVTAPKMDFYAGEQIPITVEFSEPVVSGNASLCINGSSENVECKTTGGTHVMFLYTVPENPPRTFTVSNISGVTELCGRTLVESETNKEFTLEGTYGSYHKEESLDLENYTAEVRGTALQVTVPILEGSNTQWLGSETAKEEDESGNPRYKLTSMHGELVLPNPDTGETAEEPVTFDLYVEQDANDKISSLTAKPELAVNLSGEDFTGKVRLFLDRAIGSGENQTLLLGSERDFSYPTAKPLLGRDLRVGKVEGFPDKGVYLEEWENYKDKLRLIPGTVAGTDATWMDTGSVTEADENGDPKNPTAHFMWVSSDHKIATIDKDGYITPTGSVPGGKVEVEFRLKALNGGYNGKGSVVDGDNDFLSSPVTVTFSQGNEPFLKAGGDLTITAGGSPTIRWLSNITEKNFDQTGNKSTEFRMYIREYKEGEPDAPGGSAFRRVTSTIDKPVSSYTWTPDDRYPFDKISVDGKPSYTYFVRSVSSESGGIESMWTYGHIYVTAQPVGARLTRPASLQVPSSEGSHTLSWNLEHFDTANGADVKVTVTDNETGKQVKTEEGTLKGADSPAGSLAFSFGTMGEKQLRKSYTVELVARNKSQQVDDWSRDSYILTVYNADALKILVDGKNVGNTTLTNKDTLRGKNQDDILALERQIDLKTPVSINSDEYPWTQLEDQIRWKVESDSAGTDVAILNNQQGGVWSDLRTFDYDSYSPDTEFLLTGNADGTATVTATHKWLEGMEDTLKVNVDTLRDELYLFQFYPKQKTTLTYTTVENGKPVEKTTHSTDDGKAVIYESGGITTDVYVTSGNVEKGDLHVGTLRKNALVSSEQFSGAGSLYPLNTLELRQLANVPLFLVRPNGKPYSGQDITLWGGVYRNGEYVGETTIKVGEKSESISKGDGATLTTDDEGRITLQFDPTQFTTEDQKHSVTASDELKFVLEIHAEGFYPQFVTINSTMNEGESIQAGERQVNLTEVPAGQENKPFIAKQELYFNHKGTGASIDLKTVTDEVGPSADYPETMIETQVFWWGSESGTADGEGKQTITLADANGVVPSFQSQKCTVYPFSNMPVTVHQLPMNRKNMDTWGFSEKTVSSRNVSLSYVDSEGVTIKQELLPFKVTDATIIEKASEGIKEDADGLINSIMEVDMSTGDLGQDGLTSSGLESIGVDDVAVNGITMKIAPTSNPFVFRAVLALGMDNMATKATGINIQTVEPSDEAAMGLMPGYSDLKHMTSIQEYKNYASESKGKVDKLMGTSNMVSDGSVSYQLKGWYELELTDRGVNGWSMKLIGGGGAAGLGYGYEWNFNTMAGPVPFTVSLGLGAAASLSVSFANDLETKALDSLTKLEVMAYLRAFAGVGFDYAILAAKIGLFGQVSADMELLFLNRENGSDMNGDKFRFDGTVGVEAVFKFLFINYEKVLWSENWKEEMETSNSKYGNIQDYWDYAVNGWGSKYPSASSVNTLSVMSNREGNMAILSQDQPATMESREYLELFPRAWGGTSTVLRRSVAANRTEGAVSMEGQNIYPYANPQSTDDGEVTVFLDDNPENKSAAEVAVSDTRASYISGTDFSGKRSIIDTKTMEGGAGDSQLKLDGTKDFAVAGWTRLDKGSVPTKEPGAELTPDDQALMLNGSEILASVWTDGKNWMTKRITDNATPDMAPVVATNGEDTAIVAWRSVLTGSTDKITSFDSKDYIYYCVYENGQWGEPKPIYNGSAGAVKGLEAAMLDDGTAAVVYTLESASSSVASYSQVDPETDEISSNQEIYCSVIDDSDSIREVRLTNDTYLDENPQVEVVRMGKSSSDQVFVVGWHSLQNADGVQKEDLLFRALDKNGLVQENLVTSLSAAGGNDVKLDSTFRFTKGAETIDQLGVLWKGFQAVDNLEETGETKAVASSQGNDIVQGLRFSNAGAKVTAAQPLVTLEKGVQLDDFDVYWNGSTLSFLITGTDYNTGKAKTVNDGAVAVPIGQTNLYKQEKVAFSNRVEAGLPTTDLLNVKPDRIIDVEIPVTNRGTENITELEFTFANSEGQQSASTGNLSTPLKPGETRTVTVQLEISKVEDLEVSLTATFGNGTVTGEWTQGNTLQLVYVDLNIRTVQLLAAESGLRAVRADLAVDSSLKTEEWKEVYGTPAVSFYLDPECTIPLGYQVVSDADDFEDPLFSSKENGSLKESAGDYQVFSDTGDALDNGAYSVVHPLNLKKTVEGLEDEQKSQLGLKLDEKGELEAGGATIYAKVGFLKEGVSTGEKNELQVPSLEGDSNEGNNVFSLYLPSLLEQNKEEPVSARVETEKTNDGELKVDALVQNNAFSQARTVNVTARFYDADSNLVETQTYYENNGKLLNLDAEEVEALTFTSSAKNAERVELTCTEAQDSAGAALGSVRFFGADLPTLNAQSFTFDEGGGKYTATVSVENPVSTDLKVIAMPSAPGAVAAINGGGAEAQVSIAANGETVITVVVTAPNGAGEKTYEITVKSIWTKPGNNPGGSGGTVTQPTYPPTIPDAPHGSVSISPTQPHQGDKVTITATPDEGYKVGEITVTGPNGQKVTVKSAGDGKYTFTQPNGKVTIHATFVPEDWPFVDVAEGDWFYNAVKYVFEHDIMVGTSGTTFGPLSSVTRGQVVQMLYNLEGQPVVSGDDGFVDVQTEDWWYNAVVWASQNGVVSGYGDDTFLPKQNISRQEFAQMLYNYAKFKDYDLTAEGDLSQFPDSSTVANWAETAMSWANGNELINGHDNGTIDAGGTATRAQAASILMNFDQNIVEN
ncbi:S-layer homology domain-containing protein [Evtepia gabavorous]|uniref:S-layer homology domain-containing protein n=1 Tax=Evtepia gabavorous TaxID=2211183 RepID=UPI003A944CE6